MPHARRPRCDAVTRPLEVPTRIPPHNLDAERAVLGAVLLEGRDALPRVVEVLRASDFYTEAHRAMYQAMLTLFDRGAPVDSLTLSEELRRTDQLQFVGGPAAIALLMEEASIAAHLGSYTAIVRDMAVLRELIQTSAHIIGQAFDAKEDVQTLVDDAEKRIFSLAERRLEGSALPVGKILKNTFEYIERLYERKEHITGVATGFAKLDLETSGFQPSDFIIIAGRPSMGKAQPLDARVKTPTGWTRMSELREGDRLASIDGRESVVRGVYPQGARQVYRVVFSDGRATECCAEHLWRVHHRGWPEARVLTTAQIAALLACRHYRSSLRIDTPSGDDGHAEPLPVDPWLLGALLGAGQLSGGALRFWTSDPEVLARVAERADGRTAGVIIDALRRLRLWDIDGSARFVPDIYMDARRPARVDLLRGLLDAAGVVEPRGMLRLTLTSGRLARAVATLARSLGGWCAVRRRSTRAPFVCIIDHPEPKELLTVSSKLVRTLAPRRPRRPMFVSIEPTRVTETQCIAVTHPSALYITDDHVVTHNTAFALNIVQHVGVNLRGTALVLSLEMSAQQLVQRMLCSEAKVDSQAVRTGFLSSSDWHRLTAAAGRLSEAKIFIDDSPSLTVLEARAKARRMKAEHGLDLLVIDYLQLMRGRAALDNRQQEISEISRSLKALAKELNVPVVALSQLSRAVEARAQRDFRPQLSDLRECVTGDTLVLLADGRRVPIRELVGTAPEVLAMSPRGAIVTAKSERIWRVGRRALRQIRLVSGRSIRATQEHRLFSQRGWMRISDLAVRDMLAVADHIPSMLRDYAETVDEERNGGVYRTDVDWDRIVAIEPAGHEDVFDLTVPGPESWLADGIVSHNSGALEQDSDVILFLYRARVYREDVPPEEENIAEVIIGKQRNGPIGTVKVVFLPQYARFENAADHHRQASPF
jgi:replicative DNA helicase